MPPQLVAVILARNEARNIGACVESLRGWTDAVVVWDSGSTDGTVAAARQAGALVVHRPFDDYGRQRQAVLDTLHSEWVLFVDADERATPELAQKIRYAIRTTEHAGYWIPRRNFIVGKEIEGGGFKPDLQMRLLRRDRCRYDPEREVHETVLLDGMEGYLFEPLLHYNYESWGQFHRKQRQYARFEARILAQRGIRPRPHNFVLQPIREFRRRFFGLKGWQDGLYGLWLALLLAWYYGAVPYWLLWRGAVKA